MHKSSKIKALTLPPYVRRSVSKGKIYFSYQHARGTKSAGPSISLPNLIDDPTAFWVAYARVSGSPIKAASEKSFDNLIFEYQASSDWASLSAASKRDYQRYLNEISTLWGKLRVDGLTVRGVVVMRDQLAGKPATANYLLRVLSRLLAWSIPHEYRPDNPCSGVKQLPIGGGWEAWKPTEIAFYEARAPEHLWQFICLLLYTGQRESDAISMRWDAIDRGIIGVKQNKTDMELWIPIHSALSDLLSKIPKTSDFILTNTRGRPWTADGIRSSFFKNAKIIGLRPGLVPHGLRKSAVGCLLDAGCTIAEVQAITGQSLQMIEHYAKGHSRKLLARSAMAKWEATGIVQPLDNLHFSMDDEKN